jgi:carbonic anhydrase/acetyltransferase-like protein (isoleucine patch superfamily)
MVLQTHINDKSKPLIFLGSNYIMEKYTDLCEEHGISVHGIIDRDYWGNTDSICGVPVVDCEESFEDEDKLEYYKNNFNFFCATNWTPLTDNVSQRNKDKRHRLIDLINRCGFNCISLIDTFSTKITKSIDIGHGVYIDGYVNIEPKATIGNFTNIYSHAHIGHGTAIGKNCVIQRVACLASECIVEDEVFMGISAKCFKSGATFSRGTFIHEGIYIRRGTVENEVVSMNGKNNKRVVDYIID